MQIRERVHTYREELRQSLYRLVRIPSVQGEAKPEYPFGREPARALQETLRLGEELGFYVKNLQNYAGYIEFGTGEDILGILCHVDVVAPGEGWSHDPFDPYEKDGMIYGRGTADDKGPLVAALYAMKILKDMGITPQKRIRLIVGTNEESGSKCVEHYKKTEGDITLGFSPDASFPLIFAEKAILNLTYTFPNDNEGDVRLVSIEGGAAANVVCPKACATLAVQPERLEEILAEFETYLQSKGLTGEAKRDREEITLTLMGVNAHASTPEEGLNAIAYLCDFLGTVTNNTAVRYINEYFGLGWDLEAHALACHDAYGNATCNLGMIETKNDEISLTIDVRYPVTLPYLPAIQTMRETAQKAGAKFKLNSASDALFVDPDSHFVQALMDAYRTITKDTQSQPIAIGGGTYSRSFSNTVAFGCEMPGEVYRAHMSDEFIKLDDMELSCAIFVKAIRNLLEL